MQIKDSRPEELLIEAADSVRNEHGIHRQPSDFGSDADADIGLMKLAAKIEETKGQPISPPKSGTLRTMLIIIFVAAVMFLITLIIAQDKPYITTLLVGQGTIITPPSPLCSAAALQMSTSRPAA